MNLIEAQKRLGESSPELWSAVCSLANKLFARPRTSSTPVPKVFNDPIWGIISVEDSLVASLLDLPLMQRLRRVRQLGLAYLVYPSTHHTRFEHSIGAMQAAHTILKNLPPRFSRDINEDHKLAILISALLHDSGHTVFSHVGERVIQALFYNEFSAISETIHGIFSDLIGKIRIGNPSTYKARPPPAAELLSALFVLTPASKLFFDSIGTKIPFGIDKFCLSVAGYIVGMPFDVRIGDVYYDFLKSIISGDMDCDKLDYVARDAYFSGVKISSDNNRLLSQLYPAQVSAATKNVPGMDLNKLSFDPPNPQCYFLPAIRPTGGAALEMFVMMRSYLYAGLYNHHKVRAAERFLETLLRSFIFYKKNDGWSIEIILNFLFQPGGDDAALASFTESSNVKDDETMDMLRSMVERIFARQLPERALAISRRFLESQSDNGYKDRTGADGSTTQFLWDNLDSHLQIPRNQVELEEEIAGVANIDDSEIHPVLVDWHRNNPVREDPDIFVSDPNRPNRVSRVNTLFDAEQLSNSYLAVKQVAWIFSSQEHRPAVAAAAAFLLAKDYDVLVGELSLDRAKVSATDFENALNDLRKRIDPKDHDILDLLGERSLDNSWIKPPEDLLKQIFQTSLPDSEASDVARQLATLVRNCRFPRRYYDDWESAITIFCYVAQHCHQYNHTRELIWSKDGGNEKIFQKHLMKFLKEKVQSNIWKVGEGEPKAGGVVDIIFTAEKANRKIIVELKAQEEEFEKLFEENAGQSAQYATDAGNRVSILYCQYRTKSQTRWPDTVRIRKVPSPGSSHLVLCLGVEPLVDTPSRRGKGTVPV